MFTKTLAAFLMGLVLVSQTSAQQAGNGQHQVTVHKGVRLRFETTEILDSTTAKVGDIVSLSLTSPLIIDGITVLQGGETLTGRVTKVQQAGPNCRDAALVFKVDRVRFADGSSAKAKATWFADAGWMPDYMPVQREGGWKTFGEMLTVAPLLPFVLAFAGLRMLDPNDEAAHSPKCGFRGKDYRLPAYSTVGIEITRDHRVRY